MAESIRPVVTSSVQQSLTLLKERYQQLHEIGEQHLRTWEAAKAELHQQLSSQAEALLQAQATCDAQTTVIDSLQAELTSLKDGQQSLNQQKQQADQQVAQLQQQLSSQAEALQRLWQLTAEPVARR